MADLANRISRSSGTMGASTDTCGEGCHVCRLAYVYEDDVRSENPGVVRVNLNGIWTVLCAVCRDQFISFLSRPAHKQEE